MRILKDIKQIHEFASIEQRRRLVFDKFVRIRTIDCCGDEDYVAFILLYIPILRAIMASRELGLGPRRARDWC